EIMSGVKLKSCCNLSLSSSLKLLMSYHLYFVLTGKFCCLINQLTSTFILLPSKWYHFSQFFFHKKTDLTVCSLKSNCYLILLLPSSIKFLLTSINLAVSILTLLGCSKDILQNAVQLVVCSI